LWTRFLTTCHLNKPEVTKRRGNQDSIKHPSLLLIWKGTPTRKERAKTITAIITFSNSEPNPPKLSGCHKRFFPNFRSLPPFFFFNYLKNYPRVIITLLDIKAVPQSTASSFPPILIHKGRWRKVRNSKKFERKRSGRSKKRGTENWR